MLSIDAKVKEVYPDYDSIGDLVHTVFSTIALMPSLNITNIHFDWLSVFYDHSQELWTLRRDEKESKEYFLSNQKARYELHCDLASWLTSKVILEYEAIIEEETMTLSPALFPGNYGN